MRKLKHNKLKNTGLLFELLTKAMVHEIMNPKEKQSASKIIRGHFTPKSELLKELQLYNILSFKTDHDPNDLLDLAIQSRAKLNESDLQREKYNLVKSIGKQYDLTGFFNARITNYKLKASIFKLFEYSGSDNPSEYLNTKKVISEVISGKNNDETVVDEVERLWREQDKDVRKIGFKFLVERFNEKYRELSEKQRTLVFKYINEEADSESFREYVNGEVKGITEALSAKVDEIDDPVTKIKVAESINLLDKFSTIKQLKEDHLTSLLKYYELIEVI